MRTSHWGLLALTASLSQTIASPTTSSFSLSTQEKRALLQDLVTWDQHSIFVRGERLMIFSGEFHPFRLPVPGLWLDVFQKIKSLGFNAVSFYTNWGLLEGNPGHVVTDGIWSLDEFFNAASEAGIYLIARPGPYINAETAAGGIPGWVLREKGVIRSNSSDYFAATQNYMKTMGGIIEKAQITNGGPVIIVQPENEYSTWPGVSMADFPTDMNREVMAFVENQLRDTGIVVPFSVNDNENMGYFAPGSGVGAVDLYGIDAYPMRYDCGDPYTWPTYRFPKNWQLTHFNNSPTTPNAVMEFQGGSGEGWGGVTQDMCADLVNMEAVRVVNKNTFGFGVTMFNIYMTYGGTNWGNLGHMGGHTSYDYGAAINEQREIWREKYSEEKLQANFFKVSPAFLTATPGIGVNGSYTGDDNIAVTPLFGNGTKTNFYLVRHADFTYTGNENYRLQVSTSAGNVTIPQLGGSLSLNGRDSKFHVTDYDVGGINLIYSSAEVYTWTKGSGNDRVLILYGGADELHELALPATLAEPAVLEGAGVQVVKTGNTWVIQWQVTPSRHVVRVGDLEIHLLWRNDAYQHWALELPAAAPIGNFASPSKQSVIVKGGYLLRTASLSGNILELTGDVNATTTLEVISTPNAHLNGVAFNGDLLKTSQSSIGKLTATISYHSPHVSLPNLAKQEWKYLDSLPEIQSEYNDNQWTALTHTTTNNALSITTPTSLYADDYGYHTGSLIYRGHFTANGNESWVFFNTSGGIGFGASAWVDGTLLGSWTGSSSNVFYPLNLTIPHKLSAGEHVFTVVIDHMGADEEAPGTDVIKFPRGILNYALSGHSLSDLTWKMTGNLGGEQYIDTTRGPRNEGAMYAERQGYHLPNPPSSQWKISSPIQNGVSEAGIGFFATSFELDLPQGYDIPLNFVFNSSAPASGTGNNYRVQLFVNGYQFGKYINNVGPQTVYPVPEGILNYNGNNYVAVTLWAQDADGARIGGLDLVASTLVQSGYRKPGLSPQPAWEPRKGAY